GGAPVFRVGARLGLQGWQVAFLVVGLPGLLLALGVRTLREPVRGSADGIVVAAPPPPWPAFFHELRAVIPPLTLVHLALAGAGARGIVRNLLTAAAIVLVVGLLIHLLGTPAQRIAPRPRLYASLSSL